MVGGSHHPTCTSTYTNTSRICKLHTERSQPRIKRSSHNILIFTKWKVVLILPVCRKMLKHTAFSLRSAPACLTIFILHYAISSCDIHKYTEVVIGFLRRIWRTMSGCVRVHPNRKSGCVQTGNCGSVQYKLPVPQPALLPPETKRKGKNVNMIKGSQNRKQREEVTSHF